MNSPDPLINGSKPPVPEVHFSTVRLTGELAASIYTALDTMRMAERLNLAPITAPASSPQSSGMSEAFVNRLRRDYIAEAHLSTLGFTAHLAAPAGGSVRKSRMLAKALHELKLTAGRFKMAESKMFEYGRCPCSGVYESRTVEVRMSVHGRLVVLTKVPQGACPLCGSRVYKADVLETVEALMKGESRDRRSNEQSV